VETGFFGTLALYDPTDDSMCDRAKELLDQVGLARVADHSYASLSSGERMRALIARALAAKPQLLLLDEPTAGLDLLAREQVLATVENLVGPTPASPAPGDAGAAPAKAMATPTVIMITHHIEELSPRTTDLLLLDDGRVAASGSLQDVLRADVLSRVYRCPLEVAPKQGRYYVHVHPSAWSALLRTNEF
jgi:iron complex transport system ATP-binding protein